MLMGFTQYKLGRALAYLAVVATVLMPGGLWVNCVAADGHAMIELVHAEHDEHETHAGGDEQLVNSGCTDTSLNTVDDALLRDRLDRAWLWSLELTQPILFVLEDIELRSELWATGSSTIPVPGTSYSLALRSIVLLV